MPQAGRSNQTHGNLGDSSAEAPSHPPPNTGSDSYRTGTWPGSDVPFSALTNAYQLIERHQFTEVDRDLVRKMGAILAPRIEDFLTAFYVWMSGQPEYDLFFADPGRLARVRGLQASYWRTFFTAEVDDSYVRYRRDVGIVHARVGLSLPAYFAAMDKGLSLWMDEVYDGNLKPAQFLACQRSVTKLIHIDTAIVVEAYSQVINEKIADQARSILEMSTPVTALWEDILMLPVVGIVDSRRAQDIMRSVLTRIAETRARVFIMDISGVSVMDTAVANHLVKVTRATRLMGCECLLSGLSPAIAQTIVELGIDVGKVHTRATLRDALEDAFGRIGIEIRKTGEIVRGGAA